MQQLADEGIQTLVHYPIAPHCQEAYRDLSYAKGDFPIAETLADDMLSLPIGPQMSDDHHTQVIETVNRLVDAL